MDAREITFPETFGAVFSNANLHWITETELVLAGIARSLRPGGRFVAEFGGKGNIDKFLAAAARAWSRLGFSGAMPHPWFFPSIAEYAGLLENHGFEVSSASLFDRTTPLEDAERGLRNWMEMFVSPLVETLSDSQREQFATAVEQEARPALYRDSHWVMDHRRLRIVARRIRPKLRVAWNQVALVYIFRDKMPQHLWSPRILPQRQTRQVFGWLNLQMPMSLPG